VKFDKWQQVDDALKKSSVESDSKSTRLVFVLVCQVWNPPSLHVAKECEKLRSAKVPTMKSPILLIDADDEKNKTYELGSANADTRASRAAMQQNRMLTLALSLFLQCIDHACSVLLRWRKATDDSSYRLCRRRQVRRFVHACESDRIAAIGTLGRE
jgi:hypothetical protein